MTYIKGYTICNICKKKIKRNLRIEVWKNSRFPLDGDGWSWDLCPKHFKEVLKRLRFIIK